MDLYTIRSRLTVDGNININELIRTGLHNTLLRTNFNDNVYYHPLYPNAHIQFIPVTSIPLSNRTDINVLINDTIKWNSKKLNDFYAVLTKSIDNNSIILWNCNSHNLFRKEIKDILFTFLMINYYNYYLPNEILYKIFEMVTWDYIDYRIESISTRYLLNNMFTNNLNTNIKNIKGLATIGNYIFTTVETFEQDEKYENLILNNISWDDPFTEGDF